MSRISLVKLVVTIISVISSKKVAIFGGSLRLAFANTLLYVVQVKPPECEAGRITEPGTIVSGFTSHVRRVNEYNTSFFSKLRI